MNDSSAHRMTHRGQAAVEPLWIWIGLPLLFIGLYVAFEVLV